MRAFILLAWCTCLEALRAVSISRRAVLAGSGATTASAMLLPRAALADEWPVALFSAGDPRFLQRSFDEIKYLGVKRCEVGAIDSIPSVRVSYDASKVSYKRVLGAFWRSCDPTREDQFGSGGPTIIWVASEEERKIAEESRRRLQLATEFRSSTFGPMFQGRPILTEVRAVAGMWTPAPAADQDWYLNEPKAYEQARKKTGRTKWFEDAYKPVTVTACQKNKDEGGTVCGFVYFPCSEENGCSAVTGGSF